MPSSGTRSSSSSAGSSSIAGLSDLYTAGIIYITVLTIVCSAYTKRIPIGVVFDKESEQARAVLLYEIERYNNISSTLFKLDKYEKIVDVSDNLQISRAVCTTLAKSIYGLFSVADRPIVPFVHRHTGSTFGMPYVTSGRSVNGTALGDFDDGVSAWSLHVRPLYDRAMLAVMRHYLWDHVYYIYDTEDGLSRLQNLYAAVNLNITRRLSIVPLRIISLDSFHSSLRRLDQQTAGQRFKYILLDIGTMAALRTVLRQIVNVGMHRDGFHYLLACLAFDEVDLSGFRYGGANVTAFQLVDRRSTAIANLQREWGRISNASRGRLEFKLKMESVVAIDAVTVFVRGFATSMADSPDIFNLAFRRGPLFASDFVRGESQCHTDAARPWIYGPEIYQHLRSVQFDGLTGRVEFDKHGYRINYTLDVFEMKFNSSPRKIGSWNSTDDILTITPLETNDSARAHTFNTTYIVTTILSPPYLMKRKVDPLKHALPVGNDVYEGYCADLARKLSENIADFHYELKEVPDGLYGAEMQDQSWNGMIGELKEKKAHLAIAPLTITLKRERVVDFSKPFMNLGISIMIKKPEKQKPGIFSFMDPLSKQIWLCITLSYLGVSLTLSIVGRFSPYERQLADSDDMAEIMSGGQGSGLQTTTDFTLMNSLWYALGAFMQQGCDISPRSTSGRLAASAWWFFTLILVSTYTANLAAFLTVERIVTPINSAEELSKQTVIQYGTLKSGSTLDFFKTSKIPTYEKMWNYMNSTKGVMVNTTQEGIDRVRSSKGKYAFLLESTMNDFHNQRKPCNTMRVGDNLDAKGYGIATPLGSELKSRIGFVVLWLLENGELVRLQKKWWLEKGECPVDADSKSSTSALTLSNVAGIFYILVSGLGVALVVAFFEFLWKSRLRQKRRQQCELSQSSSRQEAI